MPWLTRPSGYRADARSPIPARALPIGTALIDSTPAAITTSCTPASTAWAANAAACWLDPHCRLSVLLGTDSGSPAPSTALRPMLPACSPTCWAQPTITSSTSAGSIPARSTSAAS